MTIGLLIILTFHDYGITWDEAFHQIKGWNFIKYYLDFTPFNDLIHTTPFGRLRHLYGNAFDAPTVALSHILSKILPFGQFEVQHLFNAIVGLFGISACWKIGLRLAGAKAAFWSAVLLTTTPVYYGHMFNNPKDIPFAAGYIWSVYYIICMVPFFPSIPRSLVIKLSIVLGLTIGVRVGGIVLYGYMGVAMGSYLLFSAMNSSKPQHIANKIWLLSRSAVAVFCVSYLIMLVFWPWAQASPFKRTFQAFVGFSQITGAEEGKMLFGGTMINGTEVPWDYLPRYLLIKLPEFYSILAVMAIILVIKHFLYGSSKKNLVVLQQYIVLIFSILLIPIYVVVNGALIYDGIRHFLFLVPLLACVSGISLTYILEWVAKQNQLIKKGAFILLTLYFVYHIGTMVKIHPYQYVYFNHYIGGLPGAHGKYETDYWAASYKEAVEELVIYLNSTRNSCPLPTYKILASGPKYPLVYYFPKNFSYTSDESKADFYISIERYGAHKAVDGKIVAVVERFGVPLSYVKDRRFLAHPDLCGEINYDT